ncbi:hypothetical protein AB0M34_10790 [Nocardia sp. NPDC050193]
MMASVSARAGDNPRLYGRTVGEEQLPSGEVYTRWMPAYPDREPAQVLWA